jgi:hypothetical protein
VLQNTPSLLGMRSTQMHFYPGTLKAPIKAIIIRLNLVSHLPILDNKASVTKECSHRAFLLMVPLPTLFGSLFHPLGRR